MKIALKSATFWQRLVNCVATASVVFIGVLGSPAKHCTLAGEPTKASTGSSKDFGLLLTEAERILVLGDSITYSGQYTALLDVAIRSVDQSPPLLINAGLPSETVSGLSEEGHAGGKFPRPWLLERLERVMRLVQPDLVLACYGMNDGIYEPFDPQRFSAFQEGVVQLTERVREGDATIVWITPPVFDGMVATKKQFRGDLDYDQVLGRYAAWLTERLGDDTLVINLHREMLSSLQAKREMDPSFTYQPDAIHPNDEGHRLIAEVILKGFEKRGSLTFVLPNEDDPRLPVAEARMRRRRDAVLTTAGHRRPGLPKGQPFQTVVQDE